MNKLELLLVASFLEVASQHFSLHGCNDVDDAFFANWTKEERQGLVKKMHDWNGDPEEFNPNFLDLPDWFLMSYLAEKLKTFANETR